MRTAYAAYLDCTLSHSARCQFKWQTFHDSYGQPGLLGVILLFLPGIVGAFAGARLLARELETGTFRYAWTQGVGRMRWAIAIMIARRGRRRRRHGRLRALVVMAQPATVDSGITPRLHATVFPVTG